MDPVVVVGSGLAGYAVVRELRRRARHVPVMLLTRDSGEYYSKPAISSAFKDGCPADGLVLNTALDMARATGATIAPGTEVEAIDISEHRVRTRDGPIRYSSLVLALGATPLAPRLHGNGVADVLSVNGLDDYRRFRARLASARTVLLLGAGLIGCEFADDLAGAGFTVEVIEPASHALSRFVPEEAARRLQARLEASGVRWHFGVQAVAVECRRAALDVTLSDGRTLRADVILSAIGLAPNVSLARAAGIRVGRGIVTDRGLATSAPDVYALGDCAEVDGHVLPFVAPITHAARALATTLAGTPTAVRYPSMPVRVKTPSWPTVVAPAPAGRAGVWHCASSEQGTRSCLRDANGALLGFALGGAAVEDCSILASELPPLLA